MDDVIVDLVWTVVDWMESLIPLIQMGSEA